MVRRVKITDGLSAQVVRTIQRPDCTKSPEKEIRITDLKCIGSYNWVDSQSPKILVPGSPPRWLERQLPYTVPRDRGRVYRDQNQSRIPTMPLLPLFKAVDHFPKVKGESGVDWPSVDIVSDRKNLRNLLRWTGGARAKFRIDVQLAGKHTVLFNSWTESPRPRASPMSFGYNFEKVSTAAAQGCERSTGHHRIIAYSLDGLQTIVRFEVDAHIAPEDTTNMVQPVSSPDSSQTSDPVRSTGRGKDNVEVEIVHGGPFVAQTSIVELKTRKTGKWSKSRTRDNAQLFFGQTHHIFLATHRNGCFEAVKKAEFVPSVITTEQRMLGRLHGLISVLKEIQDVVVTHGEPGRLTLVSHGGQLEVFERLHPRSCLPRKVFGRFKERKNEASGVEAPVILQSLGQTSKQCLDKKTLDIH